jgi:hypothetical protein
MACVILSDVILSKIAFLDGWRKMYFLFMTFRRNKLLWKEMRVSKSNSLLIDYLIKFSTKVLTWISSKGGKKWVVVVIIIR